MSNYHSTSLSIRVACCVYKANSTPSDLKTKAAFAKPNFDLEPENSEAPISKPRLGAIQCRLLKILREAYPLIGIEPCNTLQFITSHYPPNFSTRNCILPSLHQCHPSSDQSLMFHHLRLQRYPGPGSTIFHLHPESRRPPSSP